MTQTETMQPRVLSIQEAAALLQVSYKSIYRLIGAGQIATLRIGDVVRIPRSTIEAMIADVEAEQARIDGRSASAEPLPLVRTGRGRRPGGQTRKQPAEVGQAVSGR